VIKESLDITINIASYSYSTIPGRFSVSPDQVLPQQEASPAAPQDQQQLPAAKTLHRSGSDDDHENRQRIPAPDDDDEADGEPPLGSGSGGATVNHSPESRPAAFMTDFEAAAAALRGSEELPPKQYVLVDHV
jgi:cyclin-dependent kinase 12/13